MSHQIKRLDNGRPRTDGKTVQFDMITTKDETLTVEMPTKNIGNLVAFLCGLAQVAARKTGEAAREDAFEGPLIEATDIGIAEGRTAGEIILSISVGPFAIGLAVPTLAISALLQHLDLDTEHKVH